MTQPSWVDKDAYYQWLKSSSRETILQAKIDEAHEALDLFGIQRTHTDSVGTYPINLAARIRLLGGGLLY